MGLVRLADAPVIGGESKELRKLHPDAKNGPVLVLPAGWEPCWTFTEFFPSAAAVSAQAPARPPIARSFLEPPRPATAEELAIELHSKGFIAFSAQTDAGDWDLFLMRPDGAGRRQLTQTREFHEAGVRFAPDGKKILYYRIPASEAVDNNTYGKFDLVIADADGSNSVVFGRDFPWASWGPDGTQLACLDRRGVRIVDVASRKEVRQLARKGIVQQLVWSPDGASLAGTANGLGAYWNIGRLELKTGILNAVSEADRYNCTPDWRPDSRSILYSRGIVPETGGYAEIWMASIDGKEKIRLCAEKGRHLYGACSSPDGHYLVFTRSEADLGKVDNSRTRLAITRFADAPVANGAAGSTTHRSPGARRGPILDLSWGWEPHWTSANLDEKK
jgi:Tol biopolymer transport system component